MNIIEPMNALTNSRADKLEKILYGNYSQGHPPVTFERYTRQESDEGKKCITANPPDILLTNYVMLELIMPRFRSGSRVFSAPQKKLKQDFDRFFSISMNCLNGWWRCLPKWI